MSLDGLVKGTYGVDVELTVVQDGQAQDISSFTTRQMVFESPDGTVSTRTASFKTDGTDGVLTYRLQDGDLDRAGDWLVQVHLANASQVVRTSVLKFSVEGSLQ